jgi:signal transduction histidine kinase
VRARGKLDEALDAADRILVEARDRASRLRDHGRAEINLAESYASIGADHNDENAVGFTVNVDGTAIALRPLVVEELSFIGREAITNAFRHADASVIKCRSITLAPR